METLSNFLSRVPAIKKAMASGVDGRGNWWVKFGIDIHHPLAWHVVQELGHIVNCVSIDERLPTIFYPLSPPPYMNGGPSTFLSWIIEATDSSFTPADMVEWLQGRLPDPVDDIASWPGSE